MSAVARTRGRTRNSTGRRPIVTRASTSSFTVMVPRTAAKEAPVRPVMTIPVIIGPSSRATPMPTRLAT